jgi:hypothetical protein
VEALGARAGFAMTDLWTDPEARFALGLFRADA